MRFWIDREDKERLENEAKMLGLNASSLLRLLIKQYFGGFHLEREKGEGQIEKVLTYELRDDWSGKNGEFGGISAEILPFVVGGVIMIVKTRIFELGNGSYQNLSELARTMGISVSQLYRVRGGKRLINQKFIVGAVKAFPNRKLSELFYLVPKDGKAAKNVLRWVWV